MIGWESFIVIIVFSDVPSVSVHAEQGVDLHNLREGDHLALFCKVRSFPPATHIAWFHGVINVFIHYLEIDLDSASCY